MKRLLPFLLALSLAVPALAQNRVPANMIRFSTNGWVRLPLATNLQDVLNYIDANIGAGGATNYAPRAMTNTTPSILTPRWTGDLLVIYGASAWNAQVWQSWGVTTSSWFMVYPVQGQLLAHTTNTLATPRYVGDSLYVVTAATNKLYWAVGLTTNDWRLITVGGP